MTDIPRYRVLPSGRYGRLIARPIDRAAGPSSAAMRKLQSAIELHTLRRRLTAVTNRRVSVRRLVGNERAASATFPLCPAGRGCSRRCPIDRGCIINRACPEVDFDACFPPSSPPAERA